MNLEKRVEQLEARAGTDDDFMLLVLSFLGCDPDKIGPNRAAEYRVTGYCAVGRARTWEPEPEESIEALRERVIRELRAGGHSAYVVCEKY